jgi:hypothetical protein
MMLLLGVSLAAAACGSSTTSTDVDVATPAKGAPCTGAVTGKRYALCGKLASSGVNFTSVNGKRIAGTLDGDGYASGKRYSLHGGSFNVEH